MNEIFEKGIMVWFLFPFLILGVYLIRTSIYEYEIKLYSGIKPFGLEEIVQRMKERRKSDKRYNRLRGKTIEWTLITCIWWLISFCGLILIVLATNLIE